MQWLTVLSGGLAGALFSFGANSWLGLWRRRQMHRRLRIELPELQRRTLTVRVRNGHVFPLTGCSACITLDHALTDVVQPRYDLRSHGIEEGAHITDKQPLSLSEGKLCWSLGWNATAPTVDIYPGERKTLEILEIASDESWIAIFSETRDKPYRIWLRGGRPYQGTLKITCKEIKAKNFPVQIPTGPLNQWLKHDGSFPEKFLPSG
ncbi:MAG TPA: hypothetical protein VG167_07370 [Verrucomicrobiae bacterium]|nr:hypothetical protein [Verrucomicrobiae bacterium]